MNRLNVFMPCGKELSFFLSEEGQRIYSNHPRVLSHLSQRGVLHFNGDRCFPEDGTIFLEALHDFYWLKGLKVELL